MSENNNLFLWIILIAAGLGVAAASVMAALKKKNPLPVLKGIDKSKIQRANNVKFDDIIAWYKTHNLVKGDDIPFLANGKILPKTEIMQIGVNEKCICLGIFNEKKDEITDYQIIIADTFEQKVLDLLRKGSFVVLE